MSAKNVKVCVRSRPLTKREIDAKLTSQWICSNNSIYHVENTAYEPFTFDHIFDADVSTQTIFDTIAKPIVVESLKGINGTIFAYGQTSSGKTYTMTGCENELGVIVLAVNEIFKQIEATTDRQFLLRVAYIEIYNEKVYDLFTTKNDLKVHENSNGEVYVHSKEYICKTAEQILKHFEEGSKSRRTGETNMNERSSRSHSIFRITIESRDVCHTEADSAVQISNLNLVDLAGSERADQTGACGSRLKEGAYINRSLLSLSLVIQKLSEPETEIPKFINYRDSKLTRILQASLGGNALTVIICTVTPVANDETYYTLNFAMRAKAIKNKPKVNEVLSDATLMKRLEKEIERLRVQLQEEKSKNSEIGVRQVESQISERETQFLQSHATIMNKADAKCRRRTWCPSSSSLPAIAEVAQAAKTEDDSSELMPPPAFFMPPKNDFINFRGREVRSTTPTLCHLDDSAEFKSSEEFLMLEEETLLHTPRSTPTNLCVEFTPICFQKLSQRVVDTPEGETLRYKYKQVHAEFKELEEFTKLEHRTNVDHEQNEMLTEEINRTRIVAAELLTNFQKVQNELMNKEINLEVAEARVKELEEKLSESDVTRTENAKFEDMQNKITDLTKALNEQTKLTEKTEIIKNSVEYEFDEFKKRIKNREVELTLSLEKERDLNEKFIDKIKQSENRALEADEAKQQIHQLMRAEALKQVDQVNKITTENESLSRRIQILDKNLAEIEGEKTKLAAIDAALQGLNFSRKTKYSEIKTVINEIKHIIHPSENNDSQSLNESGSLMEMSFERSTNVDDHQLKTKVCELETSLKELSSMKMKLESELNAVKNAEAVMLIDKNQLVEDNKQLQVEFESLSTQAMEQIEENDKLQAVIDAVEQCLVNQTDSKLPLHDRIKNHLNELTSQIAEFDAKSAQLAAVVHELEAKNSMLVEQIAEIKRKAETQHQEKALQTSFVDNSEVTDLKGENVDLSVTINRMGQEINTLNDELEQLRVNKANVQQQLTSLKAEHENLQSAHRQTLEHQGGMKSTMTWLETEKDQLEEEVQRYKREAAEAVEEIVSLKTSLQDLERSEIANQSTTMTTDELEHLLEVSKAQITELEEIKILNEQTIQELEDQLSTVQANLQLSKDSVKQNQENLNSKTSLLVSMEQDLAMRTQDTAAVTERVTDLENNVNLMRNAMTQNEISTELLAGELEQVRTQNLDYCNMIGQLEVEKQILADTMSNEIQKYEERLNSLLKEIEALKCEITAIENEKQMLIDQQQTKMVTERLLELETENINLKSRVIISEDRVVQAQQEVVDAGENLEQQMHDNRKIVANLTASAQELEKENQTLGAELEANKVMMSQLRESEASMKADYERMLVEFVDFRQAVPDSNQMEVLKAAISQTKNDFENLKANMEKLKDDKQTLEYESQELKSTKAKLENEFTISKETMNSQVVDLQAKLAEAMRFKADYENLTSVVQKLEDEKVALQKEYKRISDEHSRTYINYQEKFQSQTVRIRCEYEKLSNENDNLTKTSNEVHQKLLDAEKTVEQLRKEKSELKRSLSIKIDQMQADIDKSKESELKLSGVTNRCLQLEKEMKAMQTDLHKRKLHHALLINEKTQLITQVEELQAKNQNYLLELDEVKRDFGDMRSTTKNKQKSRRQSSHDEMRRQSMWDHRDKGLQTDPTDVNCNCETMNEQIKELNKELFLKNAQLGTMKKMASINPLQNDFDEMKRTLHREEKEKNSLIVENNQLAQRLSHAMTKAVCKKCSSSKQAASTQTESVSAISPLISMTAQDSGLVMKMENKRLSEDLMRLQKKYEDVKRLCRMRKEEIQSLQQAHSPNGEKENESTRSNNGDQKWRTIETDNVALKKQIVEWEEKYTNLKQLYYTKHSKFASGTQDGKANKKEQSVQTNTTMADMDQVNQQAKDNQVKYTYAKKVAEWRKQEIVELQKKNQNFAMPTS